MKRKWANRPDWPRVIEKRYVQEYVRDDSFEGYVALLFLDRVKAPLIVRCGDVELCIADQGYVWMMFFPVGERYSLTAMINPERRIVQWYFDIVKANELSEEGIPGFEDLYLDLAVLPDGTLEVLDEDELDAALRDGHIDEAEHRMATDELLRLKTSVETGQMELLNRTERYLALIGKYDGRDS